MSKPEEIEVQHASYDAERGYRLRLKHPVFGKLCNDVVAFFKENGGHNFVEFSMYHADGQAYTVTIQRDDGETPAQQCMRVRDEIAHLKGGEA